MSTHSKSERGFASLDLATHLALASMGGKTAHALGRTRVFTSAEAATAGSKGGKSAHTKGKAHEFTPEEARQAGRKGGLAKRGWRKKRTN
jgi:hypothetical protein